MNVYGAAFGTQNPRQLCAQNKVKTDRVVPCALFIAMQKAIIFDNNRFSSSYRSLMTIYWFCRMKNVRRARARARVRERERERDESENGRGIYSHRVHCVQPSTRMCSAMAMLRWNERHAICLLIASCSCSIDSDICWNPNYLKSNNTIQQCWRIFHFGWLLLLRVWHKYTYAWFDRHRIRAMFFTEIWIVCMCGCARECFPSTQESIQYISCECKFRNWWFVVDRCWKLNRLRTRLTWMHERIARIVRRCMQNNIYIVVAYANTYRATFCWCST